MTVHIHRKVFAWKWGNAQPPLNQSVPACEYSDWFVQMNDDQMFFQYQNGSKRVDKWVMLTIKIIVSFDKRENINNN